MSLCSLKQITTLNWHKLFSSIKRPYEKVFEIFFVSQMISCLLRVQTTLSTFSIAFNIHLLRTTTFNIHSFYIYNIINVNGKASVFGEMRLFVPERTGANYSTKKPFVRSIRISFQLIFESHIFVFGLVNQN